MAMGFFRDPFLGHIQDNEGFEKKGQGHKFDHHRSGAERFFEQALPESIGCAIAAAVL
jgi:hypothetical protein